MDGLWQDPAAAAAAPTDLEGEALYAFFERWNLRDDARNMMLALSSETQGKIMNEFKPRDESRDCNNLFMKFAYGIAGGESSRGRFSTAYSQPRLPVPAAAEPVEDDGTIVSAEELSAFILQWSLRDEAQTLLLNMSARSQRNCMDEFNPRDATSDVNNIFCRFAQGIQTRVPRVGQSRGFGGGGYSCPTGNSASPPVSTTHPSMMAPDVDEGPPVSPEELETFITTWSLREDAQNILHAMEPASQRKCISQFCPRDTSSDANNIFIRFAQGVQGRVPRVGQSGKGSKGYGKAFRSEAMGNSAYGGKGHSGPIAGFAEFCGKWDLSEEAQSYLANQDSTLQSRIIQEFAPRDTSSNVTNVFFKFAQGIVNSRNRGTASSQIRFPDVEGGAMTEEGFCKQWNLSPEAIFKLLAMPPDKKNKVIAEFSPRDPNSDVNNIFMKFADGIMRGGGGKTGGKGGRTSPYMF